MLNLVATGHPQSLDYVGRVGYGRLVRPRDHSRVADTAAAGIPWAADNDAFHGEREGRQGFKPDRYRLMLERIKGLPGCLFVTVPDVVADARLTRGRFDEWHDVVAETAQPIAFVLQDGEDGSTVPWDRIGCVFVGGTTVYKFSATIERLVRQAKTLGLWVHMGRLNTRRRWVYAREIGCDSFDGFKWAAFRATYLEAQLDWHRDPQQMRIPL